MEKYCVNCKHVVEIPMCSENGMAFAIGCGPVLRTCAKSAVTDMVTGLSENKPCGELRSRIDFCGPSGKWFEAKYK